MSERSKAIHEAADYIRERIGPCRPAIGLVLGSGLGNVCSLVQAEAVIPFAEIPHFVRSTALGHAGNFVFGTACGKPVCVMQGRFHYYEGYTMDQVTLPIRVMALQGVRTLLVTHAAGGLNRSYETGDVMIIRDHISRMPNPLIGPNLDEFGERFPDMTAAYDQDLIRKADFVMGNIFHAKDQTSYMSENGPVLVIDTQEELFRRLFDMKIPNSACNRLIRREVLQRNQMRFTEGMLYEDLFWNYQFFLVIHYIVLLPDVTYIYEDNEGSIVNTTISRPNVVAESFCHITDEILSHMPPCLHTNALMYAITILLKAIDVQILYDCNADVEQHIRRSRKQLMATTLRSGRLLSALFALLMYKPFSYLLQRAFMRRNYHRMSMMTTRIENVVDKVFSRI